MSNEIEILDQLQAAWDSAGRSAPREGDTYIGFVPTSDSTYSIGVAKWELDPNYYRVIKRAEPPRPPLRAVVADCVAGDAERQVFFQTELGDWESESCRIQANSLVDPVPMVEMPSREEVEEMARGVFQNEGAWPGTEAIADAVLELLEGKA